MSSVPLLVLKMEVIDLEFFSPGMIIIIVIVVIGFFVIMGLGKRWRK